MAQDRLPRGYRRPDERIRDELVERIMRDRALDAGDVEIEVKDGTVTLRGSVADRAMRRRLEELAAHLLGVTDVLSFLKVRVTEEPGLAEHVPPSDGAAIPGVLHDASPR